MAKADQIGLLQKEVGMKVPVGDYRETFHFGLMEVVFEWARGMVSALCGCWEGGMVSALCGCWEGGMVSALCGCWEGGMVSALCGCCAGREAW